jgi:hypothetical protein
LEPSRTQGAIKGVFNHTQERQEKLCVNLTGHAGLRAWG